MHEPFSHPSLKTKENKKLENKENWRRIAERLGSNNTLGALEAPMPEASLGSEEPISSLSSLKPAELRFCCLQP